MAEEIRFGHLGITLPGQGRGISKFSKENGYTPQYSPIGRLACVHMMCLANKNKQNHLFL